MTQVTKKIIDKLDFIKDKTTERGVAKMVK